MAGRDTRTADKQEYRVMTVALIREPEEGDAVEVAFSESARFYRLPKASLEFERMLRELRGAKEARRPVRVLMDSPQGNLIEDVETVR